MVVCPEVVSQVCSPGFATVASGLSPASEVLHVVLLAAIVMMTSAAAVDLAGAAAGAVAGASVEEASEMAAPSITIC